MNESPTALQLFIKEAFTDFMKTHPAAGTGQPEMSDSTAGKLVSYLELLNRWNQKMDLVSSAPLEVLASRHVLDSAYAWALLRRLGLPELGAFVDVGSGAGLPGIVLAVLEPDREVILCEPRDKRATFLREAKRGLGLKNVVVEQCRLEELELKQKLALLITRATSFRREFLGFANSSLVLSGLAVEMRGRSISEGIEEDAGNGGKLQSLPEMNYVLAPDSIEHRLIIWKCFT